MKKFMLFLTLLTAMSVQTFAQVHCADSLRKLNPSQMTAQWSPYNFGPDSCTIRKTFNAFYGLPRTVTSASVTVTAPATILTYSTGGMSIDSLYTGFANIYVSAQTTDTVRLLIKFTNTQSGADSVSFNYVTQTGAGNNLTTGLKTQFTTTGYIRYRPTAYFEPASNTTVTIIARVRGSSVTAAVRAGLLVISKFN